MDSGRVELPNGVLITWRESEMCGRVYYSDENGVTSEVWDTNMFSQSTLMEVIEIERHMNEWDKLKG